MNSPSLHTQVRSEESSADKIQIVEGRISIYDKGFAQDPHKTYGYMGERYESGLVPVWIAPDVPATLVINYRTAIGILHDPTHFSADPRRWQKKMETYTGSMDFMPMMEWRSNALRATGDTPEHKRYRRATEDALAGVNPYELHATVRQTAHALINSFCADGYADLVSQYAEPLCFTVLMQMIGCPPEIGARIAKASADLFESQDTAATNRELDAAFLDLINLKRAQPGDDITTRLLAHPNALDDSEVTQALVTCCSAGAVIPGNLLTSTLRLILTNPRLRGLEGFAPSTDSAINEELATNPPLANYCITYPRAPIVRNGVALPADQPVIVSMAACSASAEMHNGDHSSSGWVPAWGIGPHTCPRKAQDTSRQTVRDGIDIVLDALPDMQLAVRAQELTWRPGPFHRALAALPVEFPESPPLHLD